MSYRDTYEKWLASPALSEAEKAELKAIAGDEKEIESRFFAPLDFGTAGLRGTMCVGLHQMNIHVIRHATQAFAEVILAEGPEAVKQGVAVCHDCRNHGREFAEEVCAVMAGNGIPTRIFDALRPTPEVTFAIRENAALVLEYLNRFSEAEQILLDLQTDFPSDYRPPMRLALLSWDVQSNTPAESRSFDAFRTYYQQAKSLYNGTTPDNDMVRLDEFAAQLG